MANARPIGNCSAKKSSRRAALSDFRLLCTRSDRCCLLSERRVILIVKDGGSVVALTSTRTQWEYKLEAFNLNPADIDFDDPDELNKLGAEGWELVSVQPNP